MKIYFITGLSLLAQLIYASENETSKQEAAMSLVSRLPRLFVCG